MGGFFLGFVAAPQQVFMQFIFEFAQKSAFLPKSSLLVDFSILISN
jgi:hypothetical protein